MRTIPIAVLLASFALAACDSGAPGRAAASAAGPVSALVTLPATVEGELVIDVAEGEVDDDGNSAINYGTLTTGSDDIAVQVSGSILQAAGLAESGGAVRATLDAKVEQYGQDFYIISTLQRR